MKLLGCLIKGPLGCLAFLVGAGVVFVVFLPPACGNVVSQELETWFAERHEVTLAVTGEIDQTPGVDQGDRSRFARVVTQKVTDTDQRRVVLRSEGRTA